MLFHFMKSNRVFKIRHMPMIGILGGIFKDPLLNNFYILAMILVYILRDSRNDPSIYIARF